MRSLLEEVERIVGVITCEEMQQASKMIINVGSMTTDRYIIEIASAIKEIRRKKESTLEGAKISIQHNSISHFQALQVIADTFVYLLSAIKLHGIKIYDDSDKAYYLNGIKISSDSLYFICERDG